MKEEKPSPEPRRRGWSGVAILLTGCGTLVLLGFIGICGLGFWGYRWGVQKIDEFAGEFEAKGYERVTGQVIEETTPIESPRVYTAQVLTIHSEVDANLAIMCQVAEIHDTVNGDIEFLGQVLSIKKGAVVKGNINVRSAQVIEVRGTVEGEIVGDYGILDWPDRKPKEATGIEEATPDEDSTDTLPPDGEPDSKSPGSSRKTEQTT
jgi:hypothetical protein